MTAHPALDLARRAFETATAQRAMEHVAVCLTVSKIAWDASDPDGREAAAAAATDALAFDLSGATRAAARELADLPREDAEAIFTDAQQRVSEALLLTAHGLVSAYRVLGGDVEGARGLDPEHVALAGVLALLTGADELYAAKAESDATRSATFHRTFGRWFSASSTRRRTAA